MICPKCGNNGELDNGFESFDSGWFIPILCVVCDNCGYSADLSCEIDATNSDIEKAYSGGNQ